MSVLEKAESVFGTDIITLGSVECLMRLQMVWHCDQAGLCSEAVVVGANNCERGKWGKLDTGIGELSETS